jgi:hypothetical protein
VTNLSLYWHKLQEIMEFHAKRGNGENFIREEKYGTSSYRPTLTRHGGADLSDIGAGTMGKKLQKSLVITRPYRQHPPDVFTGFGRPA